MKRKNRYMNIKSNEETTNYLKKVSVELRLIEILKILKKARLLVDELNTKRNISNALSQPVFITDLIALLSLFHFMRIKLFIRMKKNTIILVQKYTKNKKDSKLVNNF